MNWKRLLMTTAAAAALAAGTLSASPSGMIDVPFSFTYQNVKMPAGRYFFRHASSPDTIILTNVETRAAIQVASMAGRTMQRMRLTFDLQGDNYVLRPVR